MRFGIILVLIGVIVLLKNLGVLAFVEWAVLWPSLLIIAGVLLIFSKSHPKHYQKTDITNNG